MGSLTREHPPLVLGKSTDCRMSFILKRSACSVAKVTAVLLGDKLQNGSLAASSVLPWTVGDRPLSE